MSNQFLVYRIINLKNSKQYVGITSRSVEVRWAEHISDAKNGSPQVLHRAIRKYGPEAFQAVPIAITFKWKEACEREKEAIIEYKSFVRTGRGYNETLGGEGTFGIDRSYMRGANNHCHRPGGLDHLRGDNNHMRREEHRERMRGARNPTCQPGVMDKIRGDANPAKRPEVKIKIRQNHALNSAEKREGVIRKISQAI